MKKRKTKGLGYPPQACNLPYHKFNGGFTFAQAYEQVAWGRGDGPRTITRRVVLRQLAKLKRDEFSRYQKDCKLGREGKYSAPGDFAEDYADEGDTSFDVESFPKKRAPLVLTRKAVQGEFPWRRRKLGGLAGKKLRTRRTVVQQHRRENNIEADIRWSPEKEEREYWRARYADHLFKPPVGQAGLAGRVREQHCRIEKLKGEFKATICKDSADEYSIGIEHAHSGEPIGEAMLERRGEKAHGPGRSRGKCTFTISWIESRARGAGTKLYELGLEAATKVGCTLVSDSTRSPYAEAFWRKQERKGRAHCEGGTRGQPGASVYFPDNLFVIARQRRIQHGLPAHGVDMKHDMVAVIPSSLPKPKLDLATRNYRWPCKRYVINVPAPRSLTGLLKRKR